MPRKSYATIILCFAFFFIGNLANPTNPHRAPACMIHPAASTNRQTSNRNLGSPSQRQKNKDNPVDRSRVPIAQPSIQDYSGSRRTSKNQNGSSSQPQTNRDRPIDRVNRPNPGSNFQSDSTGRQTPNNQRGSSSQPQINRNRPTERVNRPIPDTNFSRSSQNGMGDNRRISHIKIRSPGGLISQPLFAHYERDNKDEDESPPTPSQAALNQNPAPQAGLPAASHNSGSSKPSTSRAALNSRVASGNLKIDPCISALSRAPRKLESLFGMKTPQLKRSYFNTHRGLIDLWVELSKLYLDEPAGFALYLVKGTSMKSTSVQHQLSKGLLGGFATKTIRDYYFNNFLRGVQWLNYGCSRGLNLPQFPPPKRSEEEATRKFHCPGLLSLERQLHVHMLSQKFQPSERQSDRYATMTSHEASYHSSKRQIKPISPSVKKDDLPTPQITRSSSAPVVSKPEYLTLVRNSGICTNMRRFSVGADEPETTKKPEKSLPVRNPSSNSKLTSKKPI